MRVIKLTKGFVTVISKEDYRRVNRYKWHITQSGGKGRKYGRPYARGLVNGKNIYLHRFITQPEDGYEVDHINHCTLDNRRENLRSVTPHENSKHRRNIRKRKDKKD